jgi:hypothetical protein
VEKTLHNLQQVSIPEHIFFPFHFLLTDGTNIAGFFYFGKI